MLLLMLCTASVSLCPPSGLPHRVARPVVLALRRRAHGACAAASSSKRAWPQPLQHPCSCKRRDRLVCYSFIVLLLCCCAAACAVLLLLLLLLPPPLAPRRLSGSQAFVHLKPGAQPRQEASRFHPGGHVHCPSTSTRRPHRFCDTHTARLALGALNWPAAGHFLSAQLHPRPAPALDRRPRQPT